MNFERIDTTANRLRIAMERTGKKQADVARETGIDRGSMSHYLKGNYEPKQPVVNKLARALDVPEMWLWGYDCDMTRPLEQKKNDIQTDIVLRLRTDDEFAEAVNYLYKLDSEKFSSIKQLLRTLAQ